MRTSISVSKFPSDNFMHLDWNDNTVKLIETILNGESVSANDFDSCVIRIIGNKPKYNRITFFCEGNNIVVQGVPVDFRVIDSLLAIFEFKLEDSARETIIDSDESSHILISIFK